MAQIIHNISTPNDGLGDELRTAMSNQNSMNTELYTNKVDKVTGKQLSTNDFTNAQVTKLAGIEEGAEVNVQADWSQNDDTQDDYIKNKPEQLFSSVGYFHYNDTATATTPLSIVADTEKQITNNQLGAQTNLDEAPYGVTTVWNSTTNKFDFSGMSVGDAMTLRVDLKLTTTSNNQKYKVFLRVGDGGAEEYDLLIFSSQVKVISTDYQIVGELGFSLDYQSHIDNPAVLYILSDDDGSVEVNGFYVFIIRKGVNLISGGAPSTPNLSEVLDNGDRGYRTDIGLGITPIQLQDRTKVLDNQLGDDMILSPGMFRVTDEIIIKNSYGLPIKLYGETSLETGNLPSINGNAIDETTYIEIPAASKAFLKKYYDEDFVGEYWMMTLQFETVPASGPISTDFLAEGSVNKYFTDARALAAVPTASPSVQGKSKLYSNLTGTNTDGAVRQKEVVEKFNAINLTLGDYNLLLINNNLRQSTDRLYVYIFDHFLGTGLTNGYAINNANGGNVSVGENRTGAKGVSVVHTGTSTSTGQGALIIGNTNFPPIIIGQGRFYFRTRVQIPILSDGSNSFYAQEGFMCNGNRFNPSGSIMFMYDEAGSFAAGANAGSVNWKCVTSNGTSRTFSITSIPVIAGTWYELLIIVNADGTQADFYIDGSLQFSHTTNIPTIPCFIHHSIVKTLGNSQRETVRDWFQFQHS